MSWQWRPKEHVGRKSSVIEGKGKECFKKEVIVNKINIVSA